MAKYQKKYITLADASKISGYTSEELKNFTKIGLIPFKKQKNRLYIRFDAFEKINENNTMEKKVAPEATKTVAVGESTLTSLVPFTMPHPTMAKVLETVAFTAALVMVLQVSMMPGAANKIVQTIDLSERTVAYMGTTMSDLLETGVAVPLEVGTKVASLSTLGATQAVAETTTMPMVAGVSTSMPVSKDAITSTASDENYVTSSLIHIADRANDFSNFLSHLSENTLSFLVSPYEFRNLDSGIQAFFRL